jgi:DnaJ-class molecular chaperone
VSDLAPFEIRALGKIVDELDYYQILHLERDASASDVKRAYFATSRTFHPDANRSLDEALHGDCVRISKRVTEAYCVLRDPRRRKAYDRQLVEGGKIRLQLAEARAMHAKQDNEDRLGKTPQGKQFFQKASQNARRGDYAGAVNNLQMALTFEPDNSLFKEKLEEARKLKGKK